MRIKNNPFFCSWSGGKDSCLSLYRAIREGGQPHCLFTMLTETGERSRSHGLTLQLLREQAYSLGIPLVFQAANWENYEAKFLDRLYEFKKEGILFGVFGDIDLEDHREWVERVCTGAGIEAYHPLWKESRGALLKEFIELGFQATIVAIKEGILDRKFLGKTLDKDLILEIEALGIDASGEEGEFHTVVTDGPIFSFPIHFQLEEQILYDGYWFQDISVLSCQNK